jgi:hypothetical protein
VSKSLATAWMRGVIGARQTPETAWRQHEFEPYKDREVHHGEEDKGEGEEAVHQKEEGRSGSQEAQDGESVSKKEAGQEKNGAQGRPKAPLGAEARGSFDAYRRTGANARMEPAKRLWRRRRRRHRRLEPAGKGGEGRRQAAPPALLSLHCMALAGPIAFMKGNDRRQ